MGQTKELMYQTMRRGHPSRNRYVCGKCLRDEALAEFVEDNATSTKCDFCGAKQHAPLAANLGDVIEHMEECIAEEYTDPANELPYETREGGWQGQVLDAWDLLEELGFAVESEELFEEVVSAFSDQEWCRRGYFRLEPSKRLLYGWEAFKRAVKHSRRFTFWSMSDDKSEFNPDSIPVGRMLAIIGDCIREAQLVKRIPLGKRIWRVRVHDSSVTLSRDDELSPPPVELALQANRMSPSGIVMFYGAEDFDTACAETVDHSRASGKRVTGVAFRLVRELRVLDLIDLPRMPSFFQLGSSNFRHTLMFLRSFAADLAVPVERNGREHIEYVPTQAFTEYVRHELKADDDYPIEGIRYCSAVNGRPCYVLFCGQDECVAAPRGYGPHQRWLEFLASTLRSEDAIRMASPGAEPAPSRSREARGS